MQMKELSAWKVAAVAALGATLAVGGCAQGGNEAAGSLPPFNPVASIHDLMHDIVYPHAEVVWESVGTIIDENGTNELQPESEEEWERVMQSALTVAESGNLLMMNGRARDSEDWVQFASALTVSATKAVQAAKDEDPEALFDIGGEIYVACNNCHEQYWEKPPSAMRP